MRRKFLPMLLAAFVALAAFAPDPVRAQDADPVATLLRAEADRRDAATAQLGAMKARVAALDARLDAADAKIVALVDRLDAAMNKLTASMEALETALAALRGSMDLIDARLRAVETAPPAPTPTPPVPAPPGQRRTYYISAQSGDDARDGLTPATAKRHAGSAYELLDATVGGEILLRRGDRWDVNDGTWSALWQPKAAAQLGGGLKSNVRIGAYGEGPRPILVNGSFRPLDGDHDIILEDLDFRFGPQSLSSFAIQWNQASVENVTIRRCAIAGYVDNIHVVGDGKRSKNVLVQDCVIADAGAQGVLMGDIDGLRFEGCVFDHNGWSDGNPADGFKHNMYLIHTSTGVEVRNCISARASSHGIQQRPGGICEDNLFLANPISVFSTSGAVRHNVVLDSRDLPGDPRGMGIWLNYTGTMDCSGNVVAHNRGGTRPWAFAFELVPPTVPNLTMTGNVAWDWSATAPASDPIACYFPSPPTGRLSVTRNIFGPNRGKSVQIDMPYAASVYEFAENRHGTASWFVGGSNLDAAAWTARTGETVTAPAAFPDPDRDIASYMTSLGRTPTLEAFLADARAGLPHATARRVCNYVREGFGLAAR